MVINVKEENNTKSQSAMVS